MDEIFRTRGEPLEPHHLTDLGNARRLVALFGNTRICYVPPWKTWLTWVGTHWQTDETGEVQRLAKAVVSGIYAEAGSELDPQRRTELGRHAIRSENVRAIYSMITLAQSEPGIPVLPEQLDRDPWLLNVQNGTLDLRTATLRPHCREDLITETDSH
jgi:putative DNA primase/helicase